MEIEDESTEVKAQINLSQNLLIALEKLEQTRVKYGTKSRVDIRS